jgi:DNA polymerase-3 subunit gamma/tau
MRHVSLYRKWRPRTFDAVAGQEPVVRTLKRAVETGRVAHAYLFSGPRGTGKTSTAKVLAMGLNCEQGPTAEPDGTCASCRAIIGNSSMDVLEMDAASNRGIDEIRDLRDKVNLAPVAARTKVYIIDEVHMLTTEAFNALLKMLEEPPEQVVFVLATTEKHKVPPTIVSRCQSFDFRRPSVALLSEKLREIAAAEGIEAEPEALTIMAREGRGSFRDAEGLLDQLASFADGPVTAAQVRELLGSTGSEVLLETTDALYERRAADALRALDRLSNEGKDLSQFAGELVAHLRRLMLLPDARRSRSPRSAPRSGRASKSRREGSPPPSRAHDRIAGGHHLARQTRRRPQARARAHLPQARPRLRRAAGRGVHGTPRSPGEGRSERGHERRSSPRRPRAGRSRLPPRNRGRLGRWKKASSGTSAKARGYRS